MTALLPLLIAATCLGADSLYVPTPHDVVAEMLQVADVRQSDELWDLGCGDGRIVVTAAKWYGCRAVGVDIDSKCVATSRRNVKANRVGELVDIRRGDATKTDFGSATVVVAYLLPDLLGKLRPKLQVLRPGTRVVTHDKAIPGWRATRKVKVYSKEDGRQHVVYLYRVARQTAKRVVRVCRGGT